jgi:DNA invertase Pin-like site-specific DNA recombinase
MSDSTTPLAYSYVRFSTPGQIKGDSLRRQTEATAAWCAKHGARLDTGTTYRDLGKSAYTGAHRQNPDRHALAAFLKLVEGGKVPRDSYLIIENLDRLTREHLRAAVGLFMSLLDAGVNIVTTDPERVFRHDSDDMTDVIIAVVDLARGHGESKRRSYLVGQTWGKKKEAARAKAPQPPRKKDGRVTMALTGRLPAWVKDKGGKLVAVPERAAVVKQIFAWSAEGHGQLAIVKKLEAAKVAPFFPVVRRRDKDDPAKFHERLGRWNTVYVKILLHDRRTLGEFQLRTHDGKPDGDPIKGYFPAVLTEAEFDAARAGCASRDRVGDKRRRQGKHLDLFKGLLRDARDGSTLVVITRSEDGGKREARLAKWRKGAKRDLPIKRSAGVVHTRHLTNLSSTQGHACVSFPLPVFEAALLGELAEIDPKEILNGDKAPPRTVALSAELAGVEARVGEIQAELLEGDVAAAMGVLRQLEARKKDLNERLAEARREEAHPLAECWGEMGGLLPKLAGGEDTRVRLRSALRRIITEVWVLAVPHGRDRLAVVQVYFAGEHAGRRRTYLVFHAPARSNGRVRVEARTFVHSLIEKPEDGTGLQGLDLRDPKEAARAVKAIEKWPAEEWDAYAAAAVAIP